jgi:hypothetical protein
LAAALAVSVLESGCEEHKAGPWDHTPSHLCDFDDLLYDPDFGSGDFDDPHDDWPRLDFGFDGG